MLAAQVVQGVVDANVAAVGGISVRLIESPFA
jgi:hypothetical protein